MSDMVKAGELHRMARQRLKLFFKYHGFKRTPETANASWYKHVGDEYVIVTFQPSPAHDPWGYTGSKFVVNFERSQQPFWGTAPGHGAYRNRLANLLDNDQRERLRQIQNSTMAEIGPPPPEHLERLPEELRAYELKQIEPAREPYGAHEDVWLRQNGPEHVSRWMDFIEDVLPAAMSRFAPGWQEQP
jgi:hypothetical protein